MFDKPKDLEVPDNVVEFFARYILPVIKDYFETEEGKGSLRGGKKANLERYI